jgi:hypothetical protein
MERTVRHVILIILAVALAATEAWSQARPSGGGGPELQRQLRQVQEALCTLLGAVGTSNAVACPTELFSSKTVFVTLESYDGNLGGLAGADAKCQALADRSGLVSGVYKAWLSDTRVDARDRLTHHLGPYRRSDGALVALNWNDLVDGALANPINISELVEPVAGATTWTATTPAGTLTSGPPGSTCDDWTSNSAPGGANTGLHNLQISSWTQASGSVCEQTTRLYCFEQ